MRDAIFTTFLEHAREDAAHLNASSDLARVLPIDPQHYVLHYRCRGLVRDGSGPPRVHEDFGVGLYFPASYLRLEQPPGLVVQWLGPAEIFHPNIRSGFVCIGPIAPGEGLIDLAFRLFEVISYHRCSPNDALNPEAAQWARNHRDLLPLDRRPLLRPGTRRAGGDR